MGCVERHRYRYRDSRVTEGVDPGETMITIVGLPPVGVRFAELVVKEGFCVRLVDALEVGETDLYGGCLFEESDIGSYRAEVAKRALKRVNGGAVVKGFAEALREETSYLLQGDLFVSFDRDMSVNNVVSGVAGSEGVPWGVVSVGEEVFRVGVEPGDVVDVSRHEAGWDPVSASIVAGRVALRVSEWFENGVGEETVVFR